MTNVVDKKQTTIRGKPVIIKFHDIRDNPAYDADWKVVGGRLRNKGAEWKVCVGDNVADLVDGVERKLAKQIEQIQERERELREAKETFEKEIDKS